MPEVMTAAPAAPAQNPGQSIPAPIQSASNQGAKPEVTQQAAPSTAAQTAAAQQLIEVDGQKYTLDQIREITKTATTAEQIRKAANDKFRETAEQRKQLDKWASQFQNDPFESTIQFFENQGATRQQAEVLARQKFEAAYKTRYIDPEMMSPEQREAMKWKAEAEAAKREKEEWLAQKQSEEQGVRAQGMRQVVQQEIIQTMETHNLPKIPFVAKQLAVYKYQNLKNGYDAPPEVLAQQVKNDLKLLVRQLATKAQGPDWDEYFGEEGIKNFRKHDYSRLLEKRKGTTGAQTQAAPQQREEKPTVRPSDVDNYFRQLRMGKK